MFPCQAVERPHLGCVAARTETFKVKQSLTIVRAGAGTNAADDGVLNSVSANAGSGCTTTQQFRVHTDGTVDASTITSGVHTNQYTWRNVGANPDYDVKMTKVSGAALSTGTLEPGKVVTP